MTKEEPKQRFVLNLKLKIEKFEERVLDKRFEIGRGIYNCVLGKALNRYNEMCKTKIWRNNQSELSNIYKRKCAKEELNKLCAPYFVIKNEMLKEFRLSEYTRSTNGYFASTYLSLRY